MQKKTKQVNKHDINSYDRAFFRTLDFGEMLPVAMIKNCSEEQKATLENWIDVLLYRFREQDREVNFGSVRFDRDEYYVVGCTQDMTRESLVSQGVMLEHAVSGTDDVKCYFFDCNQELMPAGTVPILRVEFKESFPQEQRALRVHDIREKLKNLSKVADEYSYLVKSGGGRVTIWLQQSGNRELKHIVGYAKCSAMDALECYRDCLYLRGLSLYGKANAKHMYDRDFASAKRVLVDVQEPFDYKKFSDTLDHVIREADVQAIRALELDEGKVVVNVIKNPALPAHKLQRVYTTIPGMDRQCEIREITSALDDRLLLAIAAREDAGVLAKFAPRIEGAILAGNAKGTTYRLMNIDDRGKITPANRRLVARLEIDDQVAVWRLNKRLNTNKECARLSPSIEEYEPHRYDVYVRSCVPSSFQRRIKENEIKPVQETVRKSKLKYQLTDPYGTILESGSGGHAEFVSERGHEAQTQQKV